MPQPFEADDLCLYERITELSGSPSNDLIACTVKRVDRAANSYRSAIWCYPVEGGDPFQLTAGTSLDNSPNWSPDGQRLAFVSLADEGGPQVFLIDRRGGERRQLTRVKNSVVSLTWAPDGKRMLVTVSVPAKPVSQSGSADVRESGPEIVWRLPYKSDGLGYILDRQVHLFIVDAETGEATQLTHGHFDVRAMNWSPDGRFIVFARTRDDRCAHRTDIWRMDPDGGNARQLSSDVATAQSPHCSPDGHVILFCGNVNEGDGQNRLWAISLDEGVVSMVGDDRIEVVDGSSIRWDADGRGVVLLAARRGIQEVAHITLPDGAYRSIATGHRHAFALTIASGGRLAFAAESPREPNQVFTCSCEGSDETRLSQLNGWWYERPTAKVELCKFDAPDGNGGTEAVEGWVVSPDGTHPPGPLLVDVHGGPASYVLLAYTSHPYWNALVSRGWTILALNAVGSSSHGKAFADRLRGRWGDLDLNQHLAAADDLRRRGKVDGREAISGKSYGGYAAAWAIARTTRFRAAVVGAPMTQIETHYGTSDSGYYADPFEMLSEPFEQPEKYALPSPTRYANKVRTPMLMIQGKDDQRCPIGQAEDYFVRVVRATNTPAEMLLYPGGDHHFYEEGDPSQWVDVMGRIVNWLERWIREPAGGKG